VTAGRGEKTAGWGEGTDAPREEMAGRGEAPGDGPAAGLVPPEPAQRIGVTARDGLRLNVEIHGRPDPAAPTVVLIHGWTCSTALWAPVIRTLRGQARVVAYDQRGHGASGYPPAGGCSIDALASDLEAVLVDTVPAGRQAVLAGHSMGAMTIMAAAPRAAVLDRVSGALLASTGAANLIGEAMAISLSGFLPPLAIQEWLLASPVPIGPLSYLGQSLLAYLTLGPDASTELAAASAAMIQGCDPRSQLAWAQVLVTLDVTAGARQLDVPAHLLAGQADRLTPPVYVRQLARQLPRVAGLTELPGIGHMTPLEAPGEVAGLIGSLITATGTAGPDAPLQRLR
jgi:pimeloyl-ACP methyl ester carboxylesterase